MNKSSKFIIYSSLFLLVILFLACKKNIHKNESNFRQNENFVIREKNPKIDSPSITSLNNDEEGNQPRIKIDYVDRIVTFYDKNAEIKTLNIDGENPFKPNNRLLWKTFESEKKVDNKYLLNEYKIIPLDHSIFGESKLKRLVSENTPLSVWLQTDFDFSKLRSNALAIVVYTATLKSPGYYPASNFGLASYVYVINSQGDIVNKFSYPGMLFSNNEVRISDSGNLFTVLVTNSLKQPEETALKIDEYSEIRLYDTKTGENLTTCFAIEKTHRISSISLYENDLVGINVLNPNLSHTISVFDLKNNCTLVKSINIYDRNEVILQKENGLYLHNLITKKEEIFFLFK